MLTGKGREPIHVSMKILIQSLPSHSTYGFDSDSESNLTADVKELMTTEVTKFCEIQMKKAFSLRTSDAVLHSKQGYEIESRIQFHSRARSEFRHSNSYF